MIPNVLVGRCRHCGGYPRVRQSQFNLLRRRPLVRMECGCGVCGPWCEIAPEKRNSWNVAAIGWAAISAPLPPPPPKPMPKI